MSIDKFGYFLSTMAIILLIVLFAKAIKEDMNESASNNSKKYRIETKSKYRYTDEYTVSGSCILFDKVRICMPYTVEPNPNRKEVSYE